MKISLAYSLAFVLLMGRPADASCVLDGHEPVAEASSRNRVMSLVSLCFLALKDQEATGRAHDDHNLSTIKPDAFLDCTAFESDLASPHADPRLKLSQFVPEFQRTLSRHKAVLLPRKDYTHAHVTTWLESRTYRPIPLHTLLVEDVSLAQHTSPQSERSDVTEAIAREIENRIGVIYAKPIGYLKGAKVHYHEPTLADLSPEARAQVRCTLRDIGDEIAQSDEALAMLLEKSVTITKPYDAEPLYPKPTSYAKKPMGYPNSALGRRMKKLQQRR